MFPPAHPLLTFRVEFVQQHVAVVHLVGEVDHFNAWVLSSVIDGTVLAGCSQVVLDTHWVEFTDSALLRAIEACAPAYALGDCLVCIRRPSRAVLRVLDLLDSLSLLDATV